MKLFIEKDDRTKVEISEINSLDGESEILFFFLNTHLRKKDTQNIEEELNTKTGKKCIVLDNLFVSKIMGV